MVKPIKRLLAAVAALFLIAALPAMATTLSPGQFSSANINWAFGGAIPAPLISGTFANGVAALTQTPTDTSAAVATDAFVQAQRNCQSIVKFGGGPSLSDNTAALLAAMTAISTNGCIYFPVGKYTFLSSPTISVAAGLNSVALIGDGPDATVLYWPNTAGGLTMGLNACANSFHVREMSITTGVANGGNALFATQAGANCSSVAYGTSDVTHVVFRGDDGGDATDYWGLNLLLQNTWQVNIDASTFWGSAAGAGGDVDLAGSGPTQYTAIINFTGSFFLHTNIGIIYGPYVQGVTVNYDNFNGGGVGIEAGGSEAGVLALLAVNHSQFNTTGLQIYLATNVYQVSIDGSVFYGTASNPIVEMDNPSAFQFTNNQCDGLGLSAGTCLVIGSSATSAQNGGIIKGNSVYNIAKGFNILAGANGMNIEGNEFLNSVTTPIADAGTNTVIRNNPGYNSVGVTAGITVAASPATICAGAVGETDYFSQSATFTATVKLGNSSGPVIGTMASGATVVTELAPRECEVVTWGTTAPTYSKSLH